MNRRIRTYRELSQIEDFEERFDYLSIRSMVGSATFGYERWLNQAFYTSTQWRHVRDQVIARDYGCDMGVRGREISYKVVVHHMNPMAIIDITMGNEAILDPEYLITVSHRTHNAIHYGDKSLLAQPLVHRRPGDTKLW